MKWLRCHLRIPETNLNIVRRGKLVCCIQALVGVNYAHAVTILLINNTFMHSVPDTGYYCSVGNG